MASSKLHWAIKIIEERDLVFAVVKLNRQELLRLRDPSSKRARVRVGRPSAEILRQRLERNAARDRSQPTIRSQAEFYIDCRRRDLEKEVVGLRRTLRRIKEQVACIAVAEQIRRGDGT